MTRVAETLLQVVAAEARSRRPDIERQQRRAISEKLFLRQYEALEREITEEVSGILRRHLKQAQANLEALLGNKDVAEILMREICPIRQWAADLADGLLPLLAKTMAEAAMVEWLLLGREHKSTELGYFFEVRFKSLASDWLSSIGIEIPSWLQFDIPVWMSDAIEVVLRTAFSMDYWERIASKTKDDVEKTLRTGMQEGESLRDIARDLNSRFPDEYTYDRGVLIGRTESANALNGARDISITQLKEELPAEAAMYIGKEWLALLDDRTRDEHAALNGVLANPEGNWLLAGTWIPWPGHFSLPPEQRCNCLPGGMLVQGRLNRAMRAWYEGSITEIVLRSGGRVSVTPNHPVVTSQGLVSACSIHPGQKILTYCSHGNGPLAFFTGYSIGSSNDIKNEPLPVEQVFEAFLCGSLSFCSGIEGKAVQMHDFYGDGKFINGNIDIVGTNWALLDDGKFGGFEKCGNTIFILEPRRRAIFKFANSQSLPNSCIGHAADFDSSIYQSGSQNITGISNFLRDATERFPSHVAFDDVVEVRNLNFSGHVYDFQSETGVIVCSDPNYSTVGIILSNCRCTEIAALGAQPEEMTGLPSTEEE